VGFLHANSAEHSCFILVNLNITFVLSPIYHSSAHESFATDATDSSASILSPVPGSGFWESEVSEIDLMKGGLDSSSQQHCSISAGERSHTLPSISENSLCSKG